MCPWSRFVACPVVSPMSRSGSLLLAWAMLAQSALPAPLPNFGNRSIPTTVEFFGIKAHGQRFVYLVDGSKSMVKQKFETASRELTASVGKLKPQHEFHVVVFSDAAYPLFHPNETTKPVPATDENKEQLDKWLKSIKLTFRTDGLDAVKMALEAKPDAIFIVTDGRFTDDAGEKLLEMEQQPIPIHTVQLLAGGRRDPMMEELLAAIAKHHGGQFKVVDIPPAGK